jgi:ribosomal protein S18 acetylase RimI-like enzyme
MADPGDDEKLREAAEHRGLKLVRSRRRKPGVGDYGKYGLTDAAGKPLLGIGDDGLTATAKDISDYLRAGATNTWKISAETTAASPASSDRRTRSASAEDEPSAIRPRGRRARSVGEERAGRSRRASVSEESDDRAAGEEPRNAASKRVTRPRPTLVAAVETEPTADPEPVPSPAPELVIKPARPADAAAVSRLLGQLSHIGLDEMAVARNLEAARKARGGMVVAMLGDLVGCCAWAVVPTIQHGPVGRLTVIMVDQGHRRRGIASALVDAAVSALRKAGCTRVEAMSDIEIQNAHNFFRTLKFEQTSYRFAKDIGDS